MSHPVLKTRCTPAAALVALLCSPLSGAVAQNAAAPENPNGHWQHCAAVAEPAQRLACFDQWAAAQTSAPTSTPTASASALTSEITSENTSKNIATNTAVETTTPTATPGTGITAPQLIIASNDGCRNPAFDRTARFWELTTDTDCGTFRFRGYRPLSIGISWGNPINRQPESPTHGLAEWRHYQHQELQLQLSVRTKLASNLLTFNHPSKRDSLWFGYTLSARWQAFNGDISRPFRNTDHEPELIYVYPLEWQLPAGVRLRYAGLGINHQSNGQSEPLSRSWNRYYAMLGADLTPNWSLQARWWKRQNEKHSQDDNPDISDTIGRAELLSTWDLNPRNSLHLSLRHNLRSSARGSARLEWSRALGEGFAGGQSNLRLVTGVFHGWGDSLIDYNRRRTTLSIGLSLLDF